MDENNDNVENINPEVNNNPDMNQDQKDAIAQLADQIKTGDDALNKLKVQNLDFILDIPLKVSVELGRASGRD
jgi:flagellar motor switch/type III secretory pathway protein FliN